MIEQQFNRNKQESWLQQITPELREYALHVAMKRDQAFEAMKQAQPLHPETGEVGSFVRFEGVFPHIHPVYRTPSGKEFYSRAL